MRPRDRRLDFDSTMTPMGGACVITPFGRGCRPATGKIGSYPDGICRVHAYRPRPAGLTPANSVMERPVLPSNSV